MTLIQGGNAPIILTFDESLKDYPAISIGLYSTKGNLEKQWNKADLQFDDTKVICPLSPDITKNLYGLFVMSMKVLSVDGTIIFFQEEKVSVIPRKDKDIDL